MSYVYIQSEHQLWTVGFYDADGKWQPESDHDFREEAAERVHWLNGGNPSNRWTGVPHGAAPQRGTDK
jgi:hypothetical protein